MKRVPMSLKESLRKASKTAGLVIGLSGTVFSGSKLMAQEKMEAGTASATITNIQTNIKNLRKIIIFISSYSWGINRVNN